MEWVHSTLEYGEPVRVNNIPKGGDRSTKVYSLK